MKVLKLCFGVIVVVCVIIVSALAIIKFKANRYTYSYTYNVPACYTGIIFGAGIKNGKPSKYLRDRLDAGIRLYEAGKIKRLLLSGDNGKRNYDELKVMLDYCINKGVNPDHIFLDFAGFDTYSTLYRAKEVFKVDSTILISQNYHLDRAIYTAKSLGLNVYGYNANAGSYKGYKLNSLREIPATINAFLEITFNRKPRFLGETVDIRGPSNAFTHY